MTASRNKRISQAEARAAIKKCHEMEAKLNTLVQGLLTVPEDSVPIAKTPHSTESALLVALIHNSHQFGHAVLCTVDESNTLIYYALPRG